MRLKNIKSIFFLPISCIPFSYDQSETETEIEIGHRQLRQYTANSQKGQGKYRLYTRSDII